MTDFNLSVFPNRHRGAVTPLDTNPYAEENSFVLHIIRSNILVFLMFSSLLEIFFKFSDFGSLPDGSGPTKSLVPRAVNSGKEHVR